MTENETLESMLRGLLDKNYLYTIQDLVSLTGYPPTYVGVKISELQNPKRCGPLGVVRVKRLKCDDGFNRVGKLTATIEYKG